MNPAQYRAMEIRHKNDLMHHGIDGQKWGVKHGPPYPLDDSKSTGSRLKKGAKAKSHSRAGHIAKSAAAGAALGGVVGTLAFGPVSGLASAGASAIASSIRAAHNTKPKLGNKKAAKPKKTKNKKESNPAPKATETYNETISKNRENSLRKEVKEYLKTEAEPWNDGSEIKFLSERVLTYEDGSKSVESMFSNDKAWITIEKNYDANGKMTSRYVGLDD